MRVDSKICTSCGRRYSDEALFCPRDGSALVNSSAANAKDTFVGREILGHIEIQSLIGSGAMGRVYRAHQRGIDRDVAVKILHKDLAQNPDLVTRFLREAKVASRLHHPNVVQVLLAGQLEDETMYLVMEYLDGISLHSALLAAGGYLGLERALHITLQMCDAVGQAHEVNVVHRDVKPENIMLVQRGDDPDFAKVLDFGIARLASGDPGRSGAETQAGLVFGTARYLSPEGARGEPVGPPSDNYAIATVLYQALAGRTPFESESSVSLLVAQIHDPAPPLHTIPRASNVPSAIEASIMRNLSKDPRQRDPDAHAFGRALIEGAIQAGLSPDELLPRPAVARAKRGSSSASLQTPGPQSVGTPMPLGMTGTIGTPESLRVPLASTQTALAPVNIPSNMAPSVSPSVSPNTPPMPDAPPGIYHPSYSGRPPERRVAKTMDDAALAGANGGASPYAPTDPQRAAPPREGVGSATVGMKPFPQPHDESILGTASAPRDEHAAGVPRRGRMLAAVVVLGLLGIAGAGIASYRLGWLGPAKVVDKGASLEELLARARSALEARRWDKPAGDNVLELTDKALLLAPADARIFEIRNTAADRLVREALEKKANDDLVGALSLYRLAAKLSPPDVGVKEEIENIEAELAKNPSTAGLVTDAGAAKFFAKLEIGGAEPPKPNEPTTLVATLSNDPKETDPKAHFSIQGPGLDAAKIVEARADSPTRYVASFVFPQTGTYKIHFFARPEGFPTKVDAQKLVVAGGAPAPKPSVTVTAKPTGTWPSGGWPTKPAGSGAPTGTGKTLTPDPVPLPMPGTAPPPPAPPFPTLP